MKISILYAGVEKELEVPSEKSIAEAAQAQGLSLLGSCKGQNRCAQCSCRVRMGLESLLNKDGTPYQHPEGYAPFVKMCQVSVMTEGVSIDADDRARRW